MHLGELFGRLIGLSEDVTTVHADALLSELAMSHRDLANLLRTALKAQHPGERTYVWPRDVYEDHVVYELTDNDQETLFQRSYAVVDGTVTLGDPVKVVAVTSYVPVAEAERDGIVERSFTQDQRDKLAKSGAAMSDGSFPIETKGDLRNAIQAFGRAGNKTAVKRHILKRARALGATDMLPEDWREAAIVSERVDVTGDLVPLVEQAVRQDGTATIKLIQAGQGSSGYYPEDVLKRDGPKVFTAGLHLYLDHPSISEERDRPERSVKDLAGSLTGPAVWQDTGAAGAGLYAPVKFIDAVGPFINDIAAISGMSIRAAGTMGSREVDGKQVASIESIDVAHSVDVVTKPGAGGKVLDLIEAARRGITPAPTNPTEVDEVSKEELAAAQQALAEAQKEIDGLKTWKAAEERRTAEAALIREAHGVVVEALKPFALPDMTRERLTGQLAANPPTKDGALDREALTAAVKEAAETALKEVAAWAGAPGGVRGMGGSPPTDKPEIPSIEESRTRQEALLKSL